MFKFHASLLIERFMFQFRVQYFCAFQDLFWTNAPNQYRYKLLIQMDEEESQRRSNNNYSSRRSSVVSLQRNSDMSRERSLNHKRSFIQVMSLEGMDQQYNCDNLFDEMLISNHRRSFLRSSNNSQYEAGESSMEAQEHRKSSSNRRSNNSKNMNHDCQCQGNCINSLCPCSQAENQLCLQGYCCHECILAKNQQMLHFQIPKTSGCICKHSKCQKSYCRCFQQGKKCDSKVCKCVSCQNTDPKKPQNQQKHRIPQTQSYSIPYPQNFKQNPIQVQTKNFINHQNNRNKHKNNTKPNMMGCSCKKSSCVKKYCYCYSINQRCTELCECISCENTFENGENREEMEAMRQRFARNGQDSEDQEMGNDIDIGKYFYEKSYDQEEMPRSMEFEFPDIAKSFKH